MAREGFSLSVSVTTRAPRKGEQEGIHYFFVSREEFAEMAKDGLLLEWAEFCGNLYGTPKKYVEEKIASGQNVILEIEVQGALQVKAIYPEAVLIFLIPPSVAELKTRLTLRGTEGEKAVAGRITRAVAEMETAKGYDYIVVNGEVHDAVSAILEIVAAERHRVLRNMELIDRFKGEIK